MSTDYAPLTFQEVALDARGHPRAEWLRLRHALWDDGLDALDAQLQQLQRAGVPYIAFLACQGDGRAVGFAEAALRPYVNGCETSPVVFLEAIFVEPSHRRRGIARQLASKAADWGRAAGCTEFASDILAQNRESHVTHLALGFTETEHVIYFRKLLG